MNAFDDLDRLKQIMAPPAAPVPPECTWDHVEAKYGFVFPTDYTDLIETYGYGAVDGELLIYDPRVPASHRNVARGLFTLPTDQLPLPMLTSMEPSLFPLASNGSADYIYLVVADGFADDCELWVGSPKNKTWVHQEGPFVSFLLRMLARQLGQALATSGNWDLKPVYHHFTGG